MAKFKRILLKLSGESLMGEKKYGIDEKRLGEYAQQIKEIHDMGVQIGIVIGGGNIFRGLTGAGVCDQTRPFALMAGGWHPWRELIRHRSRLGFPGRQS